MSADRKLCPDRFSRINRQHPCIGEECVAFFLADVYDPPLQQKDSWMPNPDSKVVAHTPWCLKYKNRIDEDRPVEVKQ